MKRRIIMAVLLAAVTAEGADGAWAHAAGSHGPGMGDDEGCRAEEGMPPGPGAGRMARVLGLSDAQQTKIEALLAAERDKSRPLREKLEASRKQLRQAERAAKFDEAAVRAISATQAQLITELTVISARTHNQINALLTPEQRALAERLRPPMDEQGAGHRRPMRDHGPGPMPPLDGEW